MKFIVYYFVILSILLTECVNRNQAPPVTKKYPQIIAANRLSKKKEGKLSKQYMDRTVVCPGTIEAPDEYKASVTPVIPGIIKEVYVGPGDTIKKGEALLSVESPDIIKLQQEYLEAFYQLACLKKDYERQGTLTLENATSIKKMEKIQAEYFQVDARVRGLKARLRLLHIDPEKCNVSHFISEMYYSSPIDGTIKNIPVKKGQYMNPGDILAEIENTQDIQIIIPLPVEYYIAIKPGMQITFANPVYQNKICRAHINKIQTNINCEQQIEVIALIKNPDYLLLPGIVVETLVEIPADSVWAIPVNAIIWEGTSAFAYIRKGNHYIKTEVLTGNIENDYVEIKKPLSLHDQPILLEIVDNLNNF